MISKHQRWTPDGDWIPGMVRVARNSSLRKLARAIRRGTMPAERIGVIERAIERAAKRKDIYLNSSIRKRAARGRI